MSSTCAVDDAQFICDAGTSLAEFLEPSNWLTAPEWVSAERVFKTFEVWEPLYREPLKVKDVLEMLKTIERIVEVTT